MTRYGAGKISGFGHSLLHHGRAGAILRVPKKRSGHLAVHRGRRRGRRRVYHRVRTAGSLKVENTSLQLSREHTEYEWAAYARAYAMLQYDSNRTALWELNRRLELGVLN